MSFLRKIWAAYAAVLFLLMMAISLPIVALLFLMSEKKGRRLATDFLHQGFTRVFFGLLFIRIRIDGLEKLDSQTSYVIVANHRTALDFMIHGRSFPWYFRFLAKQELLKIPFFGSIVKKMCLVVDRRSAISRARSVVELKKELANGWSVFIYPEGQRNRSNEPLGPFFDGAFSLAIQTGAPVAVLTTLNVEAISRSAKMTDVWPGTLRLRWSEPIPTAGLKAADMPVLKENVRNLMIENLSGEKVGN